MNYFRAAGDLSAALLYAGKALETDPQDDRARSLVAAIHADVGLTERAIQEFQDLLQRRPDWHQTRFRLGMLCLGARRTGEAKAQFTVLASSDDQALMLHGEAMLAVIAQDLTKAQEMLKVGLAIGGQQPTMSAWIGSLLGELPAAAASSSSSIHPPNSDHEAATILRGYGPKV